MSKTSGFFLLLNILLIAGSGCGHKEMEPINIQFPDVKDGVVKAMTFNIRVDTFIDGFNRWANRKQRVIDTLANNSPDVIGLQEALDKQVMHIQTALPQYARYAAGRNDGDKKGESCVIFYRKDRFELLDSDTFWFSKTPFKPGSKDWGNMPPRICSWVHLLEKDTGKRFYVYNLHLDHLSQNSRKEGVKLLAKFVTARKTQDPFIVMGDFNMKLSNSAMKYLYKNGCQTPHEKMYDAWLSVNPGQKGGGWNIFGGKKSGPKIDHISISKDLKVLDVNVDRRKIKGRRPSDHYPVIATILL